MLSWLLGLLQVSFPFLMQLFHKLDQFTAALSKESSDCSNGLKYIRHWRRLTNFVNKTRQAMYVQRNIEAHSCNNCCSGKTIRITYSECVSVALVIQQGTRTRHIILSSVASPALDNKRHHFRNKISYLILNVCFDFFSYNFCLKYFSF
jgi:hypothetical protein